MRWTQNFQFFLFDFDGLLVNTEHLHYQAYINMLAKQGFDLKWSFFQFAQAAHLDANALKEQIYAEFPGLNPNWEVLYAQKKQMYFDLIQSGKVELMPGVEPLLRVLAKENKKRCVVTNSFLEQIVAIRASHPVLQTIPHWITREDYIRPKPSPDGYVRAIELYGQKGDRIIGFEDSIRGVLALEQTPATVVLICPSHHPLLEMALSKGIIHYESLTDIQDIIPS